MLAFAYCIWLGKCHVSYSNWSEALVYDWVSNPTFTGAYDAQILEQDITASNLFQRQPARSAYPEPMHLNSVLGKPPYCPFSYHTSVGPALTPHGPYCSRLGPRSHAKITLKRSKVAHVRGSQGNPALHQRDHPLFKFQG